MEDKRCPSGLILLVYEPKLFSGYSIDKEMSSDIEKLAVLDSRIVQSRPKFAVEKGALSLTNAPFNAIASTTSQHTYNIYVPSENVFVDRKLLWTSEVKMKFSVAVDPPVPAGESLVVPGRDFALCALPLNQMCSTLSATINDTTSVINSQDVLREVLRLADKKKNRLVRTAPTMLDKFQNYNDAFGCLANPLGGYDALLDYDNVPNGAFSDLVFTDANGTALTGPLGVVVTPAFAGANYDSLNGVPIKRAGQDGPYDIYVKFKSVEPLVLSPFVFSDECEWDTGLFGLNNIQLIMNLVSDAYISRLIRHTNRAGRTLSAIGFNTAGPNGAFVNPRVNCQFLTPSLDVPLPPKSVVPYMEFPRYISQSVPIAKGTQATVSSQTITLPCIPDLLIIYAKPADGYSGNEADWYFPISDEASQPLSINFDNFSGLLSSHTREQLYQMSVHNGLEMDFATWSGVAHSAGGSYGAGDPRRQQGQRIPAVGGLLVLKPSQDLTLQSGQAPSLVGNFTLQFNITLKNHTSSDRNAQLVVITANSGFFESIRGSSRIIKGVLSEQDIISAPLAPMGVRGELDRIVGGFSFSSLSNILSKAKDIYQQTKPLVSAVKGLLPSDGMLGSVKSGLDAVGYGTGGGTGGRKKSLASRLM